MSGGGPITAADTMPEEKALPAPRDPQTLSATQVGIVPEIADEPIQLHPLQTDMEAARAQRPVLDRRCAELCSPHAARHGAHASCCTCFVSATSDWGWGMPSAPPTPPNP